MILTEAEWGEARRVEFVDATDRTLQEYRTTLESGGKRLGELRRRLWPDRRELRLGRLRERGAAARGVDDERAAGGDEPLQLVALGRVERDGGRAGQVGDREAAQRVGSELRDLFARPRAGR